MKVTLISRKKSSALIEYVEDGERKRVLIPQKMMADDIDPEILEKGIPYGYPWREVHTEFDSIKVEQALYKYGIWTVDDAVSQPERVKSALQSLAGNDISAILLCAQSIKKGK